MKLSSNQQWYVSKTANVARVGFQWGFVPLVIYLGSFAFRGVDGATAVLGFRKGPEPMPSGEVVPFSLLRCCLFSFSVQSMAWFSVCSGDENVAKECNDRPKCCLCSLLALVSHSSLLVSILRVS